MQKMTTLCWGFHVLNANCDWLRQHENLSYHQNFESSRDSMIRKTFRFNFWSIIFSSLNVSMLILKVKIDESEREIDIINIYNSSSSSYSVIDNSSFLRMIKQLIDRHREIILLRNFNLYHSYWSELFRSTQHGTIDQFFDVVKN